MNHLSYIRGGVFWATVCLLSLGVPLPHAELVAPRFSAVALVSTEGSSNLPARSQIEQNASSLVDAIIQIESNGDARLVGRHGERGLMQIRSGTWRDTTTRLFGKPLPFDQAFDPALNRRVGTAYLAWLQAVILHRQSQWKDDERALLLAAYNAGPSRLAKSGFDLGDMPQNTRDYVERASALHDTYLADMATFRPPAFARAKT